MKRLISLRPALAMVLGMTAKAAAAGVGRDGKIAVTMYMWDRSMFKELSPLTGAEVPRD